MKMASRLLALALLFGSCSAIHLRSPVLTHVAGDKNGLGADSTSAVAQALTPAGPAQDETKQAVEVISPKTRNLKEMKTKIQAYLDKLNEAIPTEEDSSSVSQLGPVNLEPEEPSKAYPSMPLPPKAVKLDDGLGDVKNHKVEDLKKAVLEAAIKKSAAAALHLADQKVKQEVAALAYKHDAALQNLTATALKAKAAAVGAKWKVEQARKEKEKDIQHKVHLDEEAGKLKLMQQGLKEQEEQLKEDAAEAEKEVAAAQAKLKERVKSFKEAKKVYEEAKDVLAEEKATAVMGAMVSSAESGGSSKAAADSAALEKFLSLR